MSGQAKTEIFGNDDMDTGLLSSLANARVIILEYWSLSSDEIDVILFAFILRKTRMDIMMEKGDKNHC